MCVLIIYLAILVSIVFMLYIYLISWTSGYNDAKKLGKINENVADLRARISILNYMEKHNIDTLNIDDVLTIFPANYEKGEESD